MGSGLGSVPLDRLAADIGELHAGGGVRRLHASRPGRSPLSQVEQAWGEASDARTVFTIGAR